MKNISYANRGSALEQFIIFSAQRYQAAGEAFIQKVPTEFIPLRNAIGQICTVKVEHQATVDFLGRYKAHPIAIEAKNTNSGTMRFDAVQPNQARDMDAFTAEPGTIGLVLVSFNLEKFYTVPWAFWGEAYDLRVRRNDKATPKTIKAHGQEWQIPQKFSFRPEDLLQEWKVPGNHRTYGLHFLQNAERHIKREE